MALDRKSILNSQPEFPREKVHVAEWGGEVYVRQLSASERDAIELLWEKTQRVNFRARLAVATVCDETGKDVFELRDIDALGDKPSGPLLTVCDVALRVNKFTTADVEALEKNSGSGPAEDSSSGSRPHST